MAQMRDRGLFPLGFFGATAIWAAIFVLQPNYNSAGQNSNEKAANETKSDGFWEKTRTDPIAYFTLWLVGFTGVLATSTIGLWIVTWRASVRQSRDMQSSVAAIGRSADAAKRSADAFMSAEKAHLFIDIKQETAGKIVATAGRWDKSESMFESEVDRPAVAYFFTNIGRSSAILKELSENFVFESLDPEPDLTWYALREQPVEQIVVMPGQPSSTFICPLKGTMTVGKCVDFQKRKAGFWLYGYVKFDDVFGRQHEWRYRFRYQRGDGGFRLEYFREFPGPGGQAEAQ
jgi:hypothetical protein